jgi:hypothetical protein
MSDLGRKRPSGKLRSATVIRADEDECEVFGADGPATVRYSAPFKPRAERLTPGQLVALARTRDGSEVVVWRWFDAVVLGESAGQIRLWEPAHGEVLAEPRDPGRRYRPGSRAYLSAGLPGADWWVEGPVETGTEADVELDGVQEFYTDNDLWGLL